MRLMEQLSSTLPMLTTPGNHEIERQPQAGGMRFMAYNFRYPNPSPTVSMRRTCQTPSVRLRACAMPGG